MSAGLVVTRSARVDSMMVSEGVLLYDGALLQLLPATSARIWEEIDGVLTRGELADRVASRFGDNAAAVTEDVLAFLTDLARQGIIDILSPPDEPAHAPRKGVGFVRDGGAGLLVDLEDGRRRALTPSGARIWEIVGHVRYATRVARALRAEYPDAPESLTDDVVSHLDTLVAERFLVRSGRGSGAGPSTSAT